MKRLLGLLMALVLVFSFYSSTVYAVPSEQSTADYLMEYISRFMERRTQPLVEPTHSIVPISVDATNGISRFGIESEIRESQAIFSYEVETAEEMSNWRDLFVLQWGGYTHFDMELTLLQYDISTNNAVLLVREFTKLYFAEQQGSDPEFTSWAFDRTFIFERDASDWVLVEQSLINDSPFSPLNEPVGITRTAIMDTMDLHISMERSNNDAELRALDLEIYRATRSGEVRLESYVGIVPFSTHVNRQAIANYALQWANSNNPQFRYLQGVNCTNFISQALQAGGWTQVIGLNVTNSQYWFYTFVPRVNSHTWTAAHNWNTFARNSGRTVVLSDPSWLWVGEILQADWGNTGTINHSMVVTRATPISGTLQNTIFLSGHSNAIHNMAFSTIQARNPGARWIPHMVFSAF